MRPLVLALACSSMLGAGAAMAQDAKVPNSPARAPCPTKAEQQAALTDPKTPGTNKPDAAMSAEKSAILPSAPGDTKSAAPTVQRQGEAVASPLDCELVPGHHNAPKTAPKT